MKTMLAIISMLAIMTTGTAITDYIECEHNDDLEPVYVLVEDGIIFILDYSFVSDEVQNVMSKL